MKDAIAKWIMIAFVIAIIVVALVVSDRRRKVMEEEKAKHRVEVIKTQPEENVATRTVELNYTTSGSQHWPDRVIIPIATPTPKSASELEKKFNRYGLTLEGGAKIVPPAQTK